MALPISPRASYIATILLTANSRDSKEGRMRSLRVVRDQALTDDSLDPHDLAIVLHAFDSYEAALAAGWI